MTWLLYLFLLGLVVAPAVREAWQVADFALLWSGNRRRKEARR